MKRIKITILLLAVLPVVMLPQTMWQEAGSEDNTAIYTKQIFFAGVLSGTDTLVSAPFETNDCETAFTWWTDFTGDTVRATVIRQAGGARGIWCDIKTAFTADSASRFYRMDSVRVQAASHRLKIFGIDSNGTNTAFRIIGLLKKRQLE